jgi:DNA repair protein RecO (recombination protein O)
VATLIDQALVLREWDFSETSQTACLLCRDRGLLRGIAKGSKRERSPYSGGLEALTLGEIEAIPKPGEALAILTGWDLREIFWPVRRDLGSFRAACYVADVLTHMLSDQDPHPELFDLTVRELRSLGPGDAPMAALLRFQWGVLDACGYRPRLDAPPGDPGRALGFDPEGGAVTRDPLEGGVGVGRGPVWRVRAETIEVLRLLDGPAEGRSADRRRIDRAARLLAAHLAHVMGRWLPSAGEAFGGWRPLRSARVEG